MVTHPGKARGRGKNANLIEEMIFKVDVGDSVESRESEEDKHRRFLQMRRRLVRRVVRQLLHVMSLKGVLQRYMLI